MVQLLERVVGHHKSFERVQHFHNRRYFSELAFASVKNCRIDRDLARWMTLNLLALTEEASKLIHAVPGVRRSQIIL